MRHVDRRVGHGQRLGRALEDGDVRQPLRTPLRERHQRRVRLDADDARRGRGPQGQVEAGAAADVEDVRDRTSRRSRASRRRSGRAGRRPGSRARRARGCARCWGGLRGRVGRIELRCGRGPLGVCSWTATMPGVPLGATHSTLTSSSGASTVSPSHSLTRCGSPAISRQASEKSPLAPWLGCSSAGDCQWMK